VRCERAQAAWSERMDGAAAGGIAQLELDDHVAVCPECSAFARGARRVRELARFTVAEPVPDLVGEIMGRVAAEVPAHRRSLRVLAPPDGQRPPSRFRPRRRELARLGIALVAGAVVGSTVAGSGVLPRSTPQRALAAAGIPAAVVRAAAEVRSFHASYAVTEWHFQPSVPVRRFAADVWFQAPERFRVDVIDHTAYPGPGWARNDSSLVVDGSQWYASGPAPCPASLYPRCPVASGVARRVDDRSPFSEAAPVPTDAVVPLQTLGVASGLRVLRTGTVAGRRAVEVELPYRRARPLFDLLYRAGAWRPLYPGDRVRIWLDRARWFPLRYDVLPATGSARARWAARLGLPFESPSRPVLSAVATGIDLHTPDPLLFVVPGARATSEHSTEVSLSKLGAALGTTPLLPSKTGDLSLYRVVLSDTGPSPAAWPAATSPKSNDRTNSRPREAEPSAVLSYSRGLTWLNVRERPSSDSSRPFGGVSPTSQEVSLPGGGTALLDPGHGSGPRRISLSAGGVDVSIESNLPATQLVKVAGSLPAATRDVPRAWVDQRGPDGTTRRVSLRKARALLGFAVPLPAELPAGYALASTELVDVAGVRGVTLYFEDASGAGDPIRLHLEPGTQLPPASSARQYTLPVGDATGRFTPSRNQLEWLAGGLYISVDGAGRELAGLLAIARSLAPPPSATVATGESSR
jgi:hypothetical protein